MIRDSFYRFPPNRRAENTPLHEQVLYTKDEVDEVIQAIIKCEGYDRIIEETLDVIQCAEGILRKFPTWRVLQGWAKVNIKCRQRGDYEG